MNWHKLSINQTIEVTGTALQGLQSQQAQQKLLEAGLNK